MSTLTGNMGHLYFSLVVCLFASFLYLFMKNIYKKSSQHSLLALPPGRRGWPLIGETLEFVGTMMKGHPEKFVMDRMAKYSPHVFQTHIIGEPAAVFCGAAGNKLLFSNENKLVQVWLPRSLDRVIFGSSLKITSGAEEASNMRRIHGDFFKTHVLANYIGIMDEIAQSHFAEKWENKEHVVVRPLAKHYTFRLACKLFLSMEDPRQIARLSPLFSIMIDGIFAIPIYFPGTRMYKAIKASDLVRNEILSIIRQRRTDLAQGNVYPSEDILSHMLSTTNDPDEVIACKVMGLVLGGHDTATSICTFIVKFLADHSEIYAAVRQEQMDIAKSKAPGELLNWEDLQKMKYSWNVACEVMRLVPPAPGTFREAIVDFSYKGFSIPKGWKLHWNVYTTHMNPEFFPEPEKFDPSRFEGSGPAPYTFVPFGGGPRMCPGKEYARLMILVFMHHLSKRFRWKKMIPHEQVVFYPLPFPTGGLPICLFPSDS